MQDSLDYTATWNSVMLQTAVSSSTNIPCAITYVTSLQDMPEIFKAMTKKQKPAFAPLAQLPSKL